MSDSDSQVIINIEEERARLTELAIAQFPKLARERLIVESYVQAYLDGLLNEDGSIKPEAKNGFEIQPHQAPDQEDSPQ